jgi:hypothetical protein
MRKRKANPSIPQTAALIGLAIVGTLWATTMLAKKKWFKTKVKKRFSCAPYDYDEAVVRASIEQSIHSGMRDPSLVASEVAAELFGEHPSGSVIAFPPGPDDPKEVQCVWALVVDLVDVIFKKQRPGGGVVPEQAVWEVRDRNDPGYPWTQPSLEIENNPTPGMFVDLNNDDGAWSPSSGYDSLVREVLATALIMAGKNPSLATGASSTSKRLRRELRELFHCSEWLDKLFGQTDVDKVYGPEEEPQDWMLNDKGRGLNWQSFHADNLQLIAQNQAPQRQTSLEGEALGPGTSAMLLWVPAIDIEALKEPVPRIRALKWADGTSTTEPPPVVQQLGVDMGGIELPGGAGC